MRYNMRFYINKKGLLRAVWYNKRRGKYAGECREQWLPLDSLDPEWAVRSSTMGPSANNLINKVSYEYFVPSAITKINNMVKKMKEPTNDNLSDDNIIQLLRSPKSFIKAFMTERSFDKDYEVIKKRMRTIAEEMNQKQLFYWSKPIDLEELDKLI